MWAALYEEDVPCILTYLHLKAAMREGDLSAICLGYHRDQIQVIISFDAVEIVVKVQSWRIGIKKFKSCSMIL